MATLRNKQKLTAVTRETQEENPRNGQSRNTSVPRINEEYITQFSEHIEGRVTKKLSQEFSRTESRILGTLSKLDEFLLNQQISTHSGTIPGTFRNTNVENQGTNEDYSQSDPHPEAGIFRGQTTRNSGPNDCRDMMTGVQGEIRYRPDMVTGGSKEMHNGLDIVTAVQEEIPYCSSGISSAKQKKARSTSQPHFAVRTPLRHLKQTRFCWPFNNWRRTVIQPISTATSLESRNCLNPLQRQCPHLMENQKILTCLKVYSKRV